MPSPIPSPVTDAAEQRVRGLLAQEKWRRARDELKPLVKADRARFLSLLIEANTGLARKMLANGQAAEARQVLNYLATIAPEPQLRALELEIAGQSGNLEQALPKFIAALADPAAALAEAGRFRLADSVVLAFQPLTAGDPAQARIAEETRAIHYALQAVSRSEWPAASEALRRVPHHSAFSHWARFIKGVAAFHAGENDRAIKFLQTLPADSVPAKAARAYLLLMRGTPTATTGEAPAASAAPAGAVVAAVGRLLGAPESASPLMRAEQLWREGRHVESYRAVRDSVAPFPSRGLDWTGTLSEFYFKAPHGMPEAEWRKFLYFFVELGDRGRFKSDVETMLAYRMLCLMGRTIAPADELREDWQRFLDEREDLLGSNPRLVSLAYGWLGEQLSLVRRPRGFFSGPPQLRDAEGAIAVLQRAIALDQANLAAHVQLCTVYDALRRHSERNRLLDEMTRRFPDDKQVLVRAAEGCIERSAFVKGLNYLVRARQLDQLDPRIPELTVRALREQARQQFKQHRPDRARETLAQAEPWLTDKSDDLQRSRWTALVRHAVIEQLSGQPSQAEPLLAHAREHAPSLPAHLLFAHLAYRVYAKMRQSESPCFADFRRTLRDGIRLSEIGRLLRILDFWQHETDDFRTIREERLIAKALPAALDQPFTRAETVDVVEHARDKCEFEKPLLVLVKRLLRTDARDPLARLWQLQIDRSRFYESSETRSELLSIIDEAMRRHDDASLRQARQMLRGVESPPPMPHPFGPEIDDSGFGDDDDEVEGAFGGSDELTPEIGDDWGDLIEMLRNAPNSVIRDLRKQLAGKMPTAVFDQLVAAAKGMPGPAPRGQPPSPDSGQMNIF